MQTDRKDCDCPEFGFKSEIRGSPQTRSEERVGRIQHIQVRRGGDARQVAAMGILPDCPAHILRIGIQRRVGERGNPEGITVEITTYNTMVTVEIRINYRTISFAEQTGRHRPQPLHDKGRGVAVGIPPVLHIYGGRKFERAPAQGAYKVQGLEFTVRVISEKMIRSGRNSGLHSPTGIPDEARILEICTLCGFDVDKGDIGFFFRQPVEIDVPIVMGYVDTAHRIFLPVGISPFGKPAVIGHHSQLGNQESQDNSNRYFKPYSQGNLSFER